MWELDCEESWALKNWCFWTVVLEKTLESPLNCRELQPVHAKGNQSWIFTGRTDAEAESLILWPPDTKSWLIWKDPDAGKDWKWEEKGTIEDEVGGWHHWLDGHEFEQASGVGDGQGGLVCCSHGVTKSWTWLTEVCKHRYTHAHWRFCTDITGSMLSQFLWEKLLEGVIARMQNIWDCSLCKLDMLVLPHILFKC